MSTWEPTKFDLAQLQAHIGDWHRVAFPDATTLEIVDKVEEEASELSLSAVMTDETEAEGQLGVEAADVLIALLALCAKEKIDLSAEVHKKMQINRQRKWTRDAGGVWRREK